MQTEDIWGVAVRARGLPKRFGEVVALDGVDLDVAAGQIHGVAGPDGTGKTTLLGLPLGLAVADRGALEVLGRPAGRSLAAPGEVADWHCYAHWHLPGVSNATGQAIYQLGVNANGRYIANGDGPQEVNGYFVVHALRGRTESAMAVRRPRRPAGHHAEGTSNQCR